MGIRVTVTDIGLVQEENDVSTFDVNVPNNFVGGVAFTSGNVSFEGGATFASGTYEFQCDTVEITGSVISTGGFTGSLTKLTDGSPFIVAGTGIIVTTGSKGEIIISLAP